MTGGSIEGLGRGYPPALCSPAECCCVVVGWWSARFGCGAVVLAAVAGGAAAGEVVAVVGEVRELAQWQDVIDDGAWSGLAVSAGRFFAEYLFA